MAGTSPAMTNMRVRDMTASARHSLARSGALPAFLGPRHGVGIHRKLDDVAFDRADQFAVDIMMMALVTGRAVLLRQLDAVALDLVDGADGRAVLADDFHVFPDV